MSTVITPIEDQGPMPALGLQDINSLRQGLEEAVALTLRGEATGIVILAVRKPDAQGKGGAKAWHAGPQGGIAAGKCQFVLLGVIQGPDEPLGTFTNPGPDYPEPPEAA